MLDTGLIFLTFLILSPTYLLWDREHTPIIPSPWITASLAFIFFTAAIYRNRRNLSQIGISPIPYAVALICLFFSDWICRQYSFFQGPGIRGEVFLISIFSYLLIRKKADWAFPVMLFTSLFILWDAFFRESAGQLLFTDDHSVVIYRLELLKKNFPNIPFYYPFWNAGIDQRDFFATGTLNLFFLAAPLLYLFDISSVYNLVICLLLFGLCPLSAFLAARIFELTKSAAIIAAILSLSTNLFWFRWALKYGTVGFITSGALLPLVFALIIKFLERDRWLNWFEATALIITLTLYALWPPASLALLPLLLFSIFFIKRLMRKRYFTHIFLGLLVLNLSWILIFWSVSNVSKFVTQAAPSYEDMHSEAERALKAKNAAERALALNAKPEVASAIKHLRNYAISANPILLLLTIPGIFLFVGLKRTVYITTTIWLIAVGTLGTELKSQLELDRMFIYLGLLATLPAANCIEKLIKLCRELGSKILASVTALILAILFTGPLVSGAVIRNRSLERYYFSTDLVDNIVTALRTHDNQGRVLFAGFILHELNHAHFAPLAPWSGVPLVASSPFHNVWNYTSIFPETVNKRNDESMLSFLDLFNATYVLAHEDEWKRYYSLRPEQYELVWHSGDRIDFQLFRRRNYESNYFYSGSGELVTQDSSSIKVKLNSAEAVIKFNYFPFLEASSCIIQPEQVSADYKFIKLTNCPEGKEIVIKAKSVWNRVWSGF